jgi:hypothetical protein
MSLEDMEQFNLLKTFFVPRVLRVPCQYARVGKCPAFGRVYTRAREKTWNAWNVLSFQTLGVEQTGNKT